MDDEKELLDNIKRNLELRSDLEAEKERMRGKSSKSGGQKKVQTSSQKSMSGTNEQEMSKKKTKRSAASSAGGEPEVEVIIEEYQDPEDEPLPSEREKRKLRKEREEQDEREHIQEPVPKRTRKKKKRRRHILLKLLVIIVLLIFGVHFLLTRMVSGTDYQPYETDYVRGEDVMTSPWVENILVVGTDARNPDASSRSDCMIIVSINRRYGKLVMTSILRDSYVEIPGYGQNRINAAFQYGGAALLIQTIEENFKIGIDHYVKVDFFSFISIIDALGGVDIDVDGDEAYYVNMYLSEINNLLGAEQGDGNLTATGMQTLSGKQALGYSRIRYIGTDFARTGRQREVLNAMIAKAKTLNPWKLLSVCNQVLPELTTDISDSELAWLLMQAPLFLTYESSECRIPADHTWSNLITGSGMEVLQLDFEANVEILQKAIYEKTEKTAQE